MKREQSYVNLNTSSAIVQLTKHMGSPSGVVHVGWHLKLSFSTQLD